MELILSDVEAVDGSDVAPLECAKPPDALLELLQIPADDSWGKGLSGTATGSATAFAAANGNSKFISLRHPSALVTTGTSSSVFRHTSDEELLCHMDVCELFPKENFDVFVCLQHQVVHFITVKFSAWSPSVLFGAAVVVSKQLQRDFM